MGHAAASGVSNTLQYRGGWAADLDLEFWASGTISVLC